MVKVFPGEFYVTSKADEVLVTVLGSCVSACIRDRRTGVGGMNHFMLPHSHAGNWGGDLQSTRFGNFAMEKLINELMKAGCSRDSLEIKVFGGGNVTDSQQRDRHRKLRIHSALPGGRRAAVRGRRISAGNCRGAFTTTPRPEGSCAGCWEPASPTPSRARKPNTSAACRRADGRRHSTL